MTKLSLLGNSQIGKQTGSLLLSISLLASLSASIPSSLAQSASSKAAEAAAKAKHEAAAQAAKAAAAAAKARERAAAAAAKAKREAAARKAKAAAAAAKARQEAAAKAAKAAAAAAKQLEAASVKSKTTSSHHGKSTPAPHVQGNISIATYGAVGDGKTDNTAALNAAIAAAVKAGGANLTATAGTYCFSSALTFPNGVDFVGASTSNVILKSTANGAALIFSGTSGLSGCRLTTQAGDTGYIFPDQDPTPTQRTIYAAKGANLTLSNVSLSGSVVCIDCNSINVQNCSGPSNITLYGCHNIVMQNVALTNWGPWGSSYGALSIFPDAAQNESYAVNMASCSLQSIYIDIGGAGVTKGGSQGIQSCVLGNFPSSLIIENDGSVASNFIFTNNSITGASSSLSFVNYNPNVTMSITGNSLHSAPTNSPPDVGVSLTSCGQTQTQIGKIVFSQNDVWAPVMLGGGIGPFTGGVSVLSNTFSQYGSVSWSSVPAQWAGSLNINSNSFNYSGAFATYFTSTTPPILVQVPATNVANIASPLNVQNNSCTTPAAIPGFVVMEAPASYTTSITGNSSNPAGAVNTVVNTDAAFATLWAQLYPQPASGS
jgi:hypothetical protein